MRVVGMFDAYDRCSVAGRTSGTGGGRAEFQRGFFFFSFLFFFFFRSKDVKAVPYGLHGVVWYDTVRVVLRFEEL